MRARTWKEKLGKFHSLDHGDRRLLVRAAGWLLLARVIILVVPFRRLARWASSNRDAAAAEPPAELLQRIGYAVSAAANNVPWRADCFPQSIAAARLLERYGYPSTIHLGVAKDGAEEIAGHAWLTCGGTVVTGGDELDRYTEMHRLNP